MNKQEKFVRDAQKAAGTGDAWDYDLPHAMQALIDNGQYDEILVVWNVQSGAITTSEVNPAP